MGFVNVSVNGSSVEAIRRMLYMPTGVSRGTSTLNSVGWILWIGTCNPLRLDSEATSL